MPECIICKYSQNKLNPGKLCKKCFTQRKGDNNARNNVSLNDSNNEQNVVKNTQVNNGAHANTKPSVENINVDHHHPTND